MRLEKNKTVKIVKEIESVYRNASVKLKRRNSMWLQMKVYIEFLYAASIHILF
jgi:hypothetical protein